LAITSDSVAATCGATTLAAASTTCTFTQHYTTAEVTAAAGTSAIIVTANAAPDVTPDTGVTIVDVTATDTLTQTRTAHLSIVHANPGTTVTTVGECDWLRSVACGSVSSCAVTRGMHP
jgi:hypothetical protein